MHRRRRLLPVVQRRSPATRRLLRRLLPLAALAFAFAPGASAVLDESDDLVARPDGGLAPEPPSPGARRALLDLYAPVVLLAPGERALPAQVEWYLARSRLVEPEGGGAVIPARLGGRQAPRLKPAPGALGGSADPADWTAYGHVYRAADGGVLVQYWFFYAYNQFHGFGDHEADWEHVTVRVGPEGRPRGAWYSRHDRNAPGVWVAWSALPREGSHPVVLSARGSHASYVRPGTLAWYDEACPTVRPEQAAERGCRVWRSWSGATGGVEDLGSRDAPGVPWLAWPGRWGDEGGVGDDGAGPPGPAFQPGWCSMGSPDCS
jgi:hypothetical protein